MASAIQPTEETVVVDELRDAGARTISWEHALNLYRVALQVNRTASELHVIDDRFGNLLGSSRVEGSALEGLPDQKSDEFWDRMLTDGRTADPLTEATRGALSRHVAIEVARIQRALFNTSLAIQELADELGVPICSVEGAPDGRTDEEQFAFWQPFYDEAEVE